MNRKLLDFVAPLIFLTLATALIALTNADREVSKLFYSGNWSFGDRYPWRTLYEINSLPACVLAFAGFLAAVLGYFKEEYGHLVRPGIFLVVLLALGPGLLVNMTFKDHWGRPRPRQVQELGGTAPFLQPWQKGISGDRSFPSGHAAGAFYMTAPFFIYRRRKPRVAHAWLASGLFFGVVMGIARISQGGHFLSDILWAWGMIHLCAVALYYVMGFDSETVHAPGI